MRSDNPLRLHPALTGPTAAGRMRAQGALSRSRECIRPALQALALQFVAIHKWASTPG
jgi:hypothetical protein